MADISRPFLFLLVLILGIAGNWFIPCVIYWKKFGLFKKRPKGFVGSNFWGVVMDVILAGIINVAVLNLLFVINRPVLRIDLLITLFFGFLSMVATHYFMAVTHWKEWIMPRPWHWNLGGWWHTISMTVQMGFSFYPLVLFSKNPGLLLLPVTQMTLVIVAICGLLFLWALMLKNKTVRFGPIEISGEPW